MSILDNALRPIIPPFCISENLTGIHIQLLSLVSVTYPIVLVFLTCLLMELHSRNNRLVCVLWKPFSFVLKKCKIEAATSDSVVHAFATFIFLTYTTIFYTFVTILNNTNVYDHSGRFQKQTTSIDPTVEWGSKTHIGYILVAAIPLLFLTLLPFLLLSIYPTKIYKCLSIFLSARVRLAVMIFVESLNSCYKDGLNGTRDYRALAGLTPLVIVLAWFSIMLLGMFGYGGDMATAFFILICIFFLCLIRPCKSHISNVSLQFHGIMGIVLCLVEHMWYNDQLRVKTTTLENTIVFVYISPHIFIFICLISYIVKHNCCNFRSFLNQARRLRHSASYQQMN